MDQSVTVESSIDVPRPADQVGAILFDTSGPGPWADPDEVEFTLPGPRCGEIGHRFGHVRSSSLSACLVDEIVGLVPGRTRLVRSLSTRDCWSSIRVVPLTDEVCRVELTDHARASASGVEEYRACVNNVHLVRLAQVYVAATGSTPPAAFAGALASHAARVRESPPVMVPVRASAVIQVPASPAVTWSIVRDPNLGGLPSVHDEYRYEIMRGDDHPGARETWVGERTSSIDTLLADVAYVVDEVPGELLVVQGAGSPSRACHTLRISPGPSGSILTVEVTVGARSDSEVVRGRWQRAVDRYARRTRLLAADRA
ncbi:SRPBCC family protein [Cellulomonas sp. URHD0024]|uniref:SRPBCC family protein n=1 Tax=Cellulomonas sp. URHD0024 TaxID=1302620 RepID=UPI0012DC771E|nr:SRPBCC family protein [Cellulomonas sp. URHD0024]